MHNYQYNLGQIFHSLAEGNNDTALNLTNGEKINYDLLNNQSNKIANYLLFKGVKTNDVIAIFNNKSVQSYSIMIACLKIGAIYTNLDYNSPVERINRMIQICNPKFLFTNQHNSVKLFDTDFNKVNYFDYTIPDFQKAIDSFPFELPDITHSVHGSNPAYIMFTSGSTGFPKGVVITHSNVLNFIEWAKSTYQITKEDIFTNINPMHFDNSVFDFYSSLFTGAGLIPVTEELTKNPRKLIEILNLIKPTIWFSVPSMLVYVIKLRAFTETDLQSLRVFTFGGEGFPKNQLRNLWTLFSSRVKFINVYGPTECTCICSSYDVTEKDINSDELLPLGPISPNFGQLILDENSKLVQDGEIGELCLTGPNVGLGYYNNAEKTGEVFIQSPINNKYRDIIYKSGDLVKYDSRKKLISFSGRKDNQIKRMGYRIELEEIENALSAISYIEENAVVYLKTDDDNGKIIACIRTNQNNEKIILDDLSKFVPSYMLPSEFKFYVHLPKNQNGKIDRLKLKEECL